LIAAGIEAVMYLGYGAFLGFLPLYAKTVGLNDAEIAIVLGSQLATAVVAKPIGGRLSDRLGRKPVIVHRPPPLRRGASADLPVRKPCDPCRRGAASRPRHRRGDAGNQRADRRSRFGATAGRSHGRVRDDLDIGEAAGPIIAGFLIGGLGLCLDLRYTRLITVAVSVGVVVLVAGSEDRDRWATPFHAPVGRRAVKLP